MCVEPAFVLRNVLQWGMSAWRQNAETRKCDHGNENDLLTLGRQRCKHIASGKAVALGLRTLLRMIIGCGRNRILCFSRCTLWSEMGRFKW